MRCILRKVHLPSGLVSVLKRLFQMWSVLVLLKCPVRTVKPDALLLCTLYSCIAE